MIYDGGTYLYGYRHKSNINHIPDTIIYMQYSKAHIRYCSHCRVEETQTPKKLINFIKSFVRCDSKFMGQLDWATGYSDI